MNAKGQIYIAAVSAVAAVLITYLVLTSTAELFALSANELLAVLTFAAIGLLAERMATNFRVGNGQRHAQSSLAFLPFIGSLLLFHTAAAVLSIAVVNAISQALIRRNDSARVAFNVSQGVICASAAAFVYQLTSGATSEFGASNVLAFVALVLVFFSVNIILSSIGIALLRDLPLSTVLATVAGPGGANLAYDVLVSPLALLPVVLYEPLHVGGLFLTITPLLVVRRSYAARLELIQANQDLLFVLVKAIETRDPYTSGHSRRVAAMARKIADDLRLSARMVHDVEQAALLHDIGKIDEDFAFVLRKPHDLTDAERKLIETHAARGADLLESLSSVPRRVVDAVRFHHERFDGKGYPTGIKGEDIPLAARIIMICDSVDAMLSDRPYRKALPLEKVHSELVRCAGSQFDPEIVRVMLEKATLDKASSLAATIPQSHPQLRTDVAIA